MVDVAGGLCNGGIVRTEPEERVEAQATFLGPSGRPDPGPTSESSRVASDTTRCRPSAHLHEIMSVVPPGRFPNLVFEAPEAQTTTSGS